MPGLDLAASAKPSVEHYGKARAFRDRVGDESDAYIAASRKMIEPIRARIKRHPERHFRTEALRGFERQWRVNMPQEFSIDLATEWQKHGVTMVERRLTVADFRQEEWRADYFEREVGLGVVTVTLNNKVATVRFRSKAIFNLRALAEWYRWSWDTRDAALIRDLVAVGEVDAATLPEGEGCITIPIGTEGAGWRARAVEARINESTTELVICCRGWWV